MKQEASKENQKIIMTAVANPEQQQSTRRSPDWLVEGSNLAIGIVMGVALTLAGTHLSSQKQEPDSIAATPIQSVEVARVEASRVKRTIEATGTVAASELIPVLTQATGLQVQEILAEEGEWVETQLLARLDDSVLQAQLAQAQASVAQAQARLAELEAGTRSEEIARASERVKSAQAAVEQAESDLELAKTRVQRYQSLKAQGAIAQDRLDEVINDARAKEATLLQAQASLREAQQQLSQLQSGPRPEAIAQARAQLAQEQAQEQLVRAQLKDTQVVAPVSGKIVTRNARVGDITSPSQKLFEIIENGRLELRLKVPETQVGQIRPGQRVEIASDAFSELEMQGEVREVNPAIDAQTRQATVIVDLPAREFLKPGMFLSGSIITDTQTGLTLPAAAVLPRNESKATVFKLHKDGTVKARSVITGDILADGRVEIISGLNPGESVIVKGAAYLKEGDRVEVVN